MKHKFPGYLIAAALSTTRALASPALARGSFGGGMGGGLHGGMGGGMHFGAMGGGRISPAGVEANVSALRISRKVGAEAIFAPIVGICERIALTSDATVAISFGTGGMCAAIVSTYDATKAICAAI